jgi:hypothetical protein
MLIFYEPRGTGFIHVEVNAALIDVVARNMPTERIQFLAEPDHLAQVIKRLQKAGIDNVEPIAIQVPPHDIPEKKRFFHEMRLASQAFSIARQHNKSKIIACSATTSVLIALKFQLLFSKVKCFAIPHDVLEAITKPPHLRLLKKRFFWFGSWLLFGNSKYLTYVLLGVSIRQELCRRFPRLEQYTISIDLPYFFQKTSFSNIPTNPILKFGSFGVGHRNKNTHLFFEMAIEIAKLKLLKHSEFIWVGPIWDRADNPQYNTDSVLVPSPDIPLEREVFDLLADQIDYAVFLYDRDSYRLKASGAFFDAISHLLPVIAIRNVFFEQYFDRMGDIGYLCTDFQDVKNTIIALLAQWPQERYLQQRQNILAGRSKLNQDELLRLIKE